MWSGWKDLERASAMADAPFDSLPSAYATIEMLYATDLQWDRFQAAATAPFGTLPISAAWAVEAHLFLVAADNARDRSAVWAEAVEDDEALALAARLDNPDVKAFRHHQEHLEERMPGRAREHLAQLSAPGNAMIHLEGDARAFVMNNLRDGRHLSFGDSEIDLTAAHVAVIQVAGGMHKWFTARSRFPSAFPYGA
jgi:hypothetical protein